MKEPVSIIVNADDLGLSLDVNAAIFGLMARRKVSSATLLANAPAVQQACRELAHFPDRSFGVHLNITEFEPLSRGGALLIDPAAKTMTRDIATRSASAALIRAVYEEFCAQVDRLAALGVQITHFDSHHHVHTLPFVFPALKALQRRYRVRRVRLSKNIYTDADTPSAALRWQKTAYNSFLRRIYRTATTAGFTELRSYAEIARRCLPPFESVELMVHPGSHRYAAETGMLEQGWAADWSRFRLISYAEIGW